MSSHLGWRCMGRWASALLIAVATIVAASTARAQEPRGVATLFTQQDVVQAFDVITGKGYQIGTATGRVSGTTFVEFQFAPAAPPTGDVLPITFHGTVIVTDLDGDQLFFDSDGTGSYHLGVPGFDFRGSGGPLRGTYLLTGATGKYADWKIGTTLDYKAITTNPPALAGALGTVYAEVAYRARNKR